MKKFLKGFTLAELLLCIAIIGVVSAMGMTITKKTTDRAYNLYFYSGYINLYNAIADAKAQGAESNADIMNHVKNLFDSDLSSSETDQPVELFSWPSTVDSENFNVIVTTNAVKYYYAKNLDNRANGLGTLVGSNIEYKAFPITMTVPQRQTRSNNGTATVHLLYIDNNGGYLIPVPGNDVVDLQNRRDLLPAYVDDGKVGRNNVINRDNGWSYERPMYLSFREVYCSIKGNSTINNVINCNEFTADKKGALVIANPQKVK